MSLTASKHVWNNSKASGSALVVLLALADYADNCGLSWPTVKTLATKTRMSIRSVQHHLGQLKKAGEIIVIDGDNYWSANRYQILGLQGGGAVDDGGVVQSTAPAGAGVSTGGGAADDTHKNPSVINHQMNPPIEPQTTTPAPDVVVSTQPTSLEKVQEFKTQAPERRPSQADDEGGEDFMETADLPPSPHAPNLVAPPLPQRQAWKEFFTGCSDSELMTMELKFGAKHVNAWIDKARCMNLDNPPGYVRSKLGTDIPAQFRYPDGLLANDPKRYITGKYADFIES